MKVAVMPARGGSKRIPRKNIRSFAGRPMMEWPLATALASGLFDAVVVSTDDDQIAAVARGAGATVPFIRPPDLADDVTGTGEVVAHALSWAQGEAWAVDVACCIYPTAPFLRADDLARALDVLTAAPDGDVDYVFAAGRYSYPVHRALTQSGDGGIQMLFPEHARTRSQDLPAVFHDAGQFYWGREQAWRERRPVFGRRSRLLELSAWQVQDIDTPQDWTMAEHLFEIRRRTADDA